MAFSDQLIPFVVISWETHFRLLADSRMSSRICWWEEPSMLTPLMVTMMSPEKDKR